jgi:hypothetical protein
MKLLPALAVLFAAPALATPRCIVVYEGICFETQAQYDAFMGWGPEQQQLEIEANN